MKLGTKTPEMPNPARIPLTQGHPPFMPCREHITASLLTPLGGGPELHGDCLELGEGKGQILWNDNDRLAAQNRTEIRQVGVSEPACVRPLLFGQVGPILCGQPRIERSDLLCSTPPSWTCARR